MFIENLIIKYYPGLFILTKKRIYLLTFHVDYLHALFKPKQSVVKALAHYITERNVWIFTLKKVVNTKTE